MLGALPYFSVASPYDAINFDYKYTIYVLLFHSFPPGLVSPMPTHKHICEELVEIVSHSCDIDTADDWNNNGISMQLFADVAAKGTSMRPKRHDSPSSFSSSYYPSGSHSSSRSPSSAGNTRHATQPFQHMGTSTYKRAHLTTRSRHSHLTSKSRFARSIQTQHQPQMELESGTKNPASGIFASLMGASKSETPLTGGTAQYNSISTATTQSQGRKRSAAVEAAPVRDSFRSTYVTYTNSKIVSDPNTNTKNEINNSIARNAYMGSGKSKLRSLLELNSNRDLDQDHLDLQEIASETRPKDSDTKANVDVIETTKRLQPLSRFVRSASASASGAASSNALHRTTRSTATSTSDDDSDLYKNEEIQSQQEQQLQQQNQQGEVSGLEKIFLQTLKDNYRQLFLVIKSVLNQGHVSWIFKITIVLKLNKKTKQYHSTNSLKYKL